MLRLALESILIILALDLLGPSLSGVLLQFLCVEVGVANCLTKMDGPLDSICHVSEPQSTVY